VLAFHGSVDDDATKHNGIRLVLRPALGFNPKDEHKRVSPTDYKKVQLEILPNARGETEK
jgi:hypothetical protein